MQELGPRVPTLTRLAVIGDTIGDPLSRTHLVPRSTSHSSSWLSNTRIAPSLHSWRSSLQDLF
ncbi:hypothetical protein AXF42_Ash006227 [Apostasia shenzhenica]|uniref:Uncharacterized protein n=1 Tax=Apostasia shenzhenica TaxID=1088818 RepID=A0A2I0B0K8_9ASPA|nr:hypothetical protein AXF42_Ash006227 [Apostasia shenzhenica]